MSNQRRGGMIQLSTAGVIQDAKGSFSYGLGVPTKKAHYGPTGELQGFSETPNTAFIEGTITDRGNLDVEALGRLGGVVEGRGSKFSGLTITLDLANGKVIALSNAGWAGGEVTGTTDEGEIPVRWEGGPCMEILDQ